jgi:hypothetical protein
MPLRAVVLFGVGPAFGGFRIALRAGSLGLDHPLAFQELERAVMRAQSLLMPHPPEAWPGMGEAAFRAAVPRLGGHEGTLDVMGSATSHVDGEVLLRASLPLRGWPFGRWVVYEGWHRTGTGTWSLFTADELQDVW